MVPTKTSTYPQHQLDSVTGDVEALFEELETALLDSHERLASKTEGRGRFVEALRNSPPAREWLLDDHFCKSLVAQVPRMVSRILRLEPIVVTRVPDDAVNLFLHEAVRSYTFGFFQATVALAGAAMEHALRGHVPYAGVNSWLLEDLITAAERFKVLDSARLQLAKHVQRSRNRVVAGAWV